MVLGILFEGLEPPGDLDRFCERPAEIVLRPLGFAPMQRGRRMKFGHPVERGRIFRVARSDSS